MTFLYDHSADDAADVTGALDMMGFSVALPLKALATPWLGWPVAGLFYSPVILHWAVCAGFESSLTVPLSGAELR